MFEADLFQECCRILQREKTRSSLRHPSCNGMIEWFNQTLIEMIKLFINGKQNLWDINLGCLSSAYRVAKHESTNFTPNRLMLGRETITP